MSRTLGLSAHHSGFREKREQGRSAPAPIVLEHSRRLSSGDEGVQSHGRTIENLGHVEEEPVGRWQGRKHGWQSSS
jgi:hypothetical protein